MKKIVNQNEELFKFEDTLTDDEIQNLVIKHMEDNAWEKSGYEEIMELTELLKRLELKIEIVPEGEIPIGITIHNDGKERHMSFEARCLEVIEHSGFGENQEEAIEELKGYVAKKIKDLQEIDYTKITDVAWDNTPTEEYLKNFHIKHG